MNKERFHNALALSLGYEHILNLKDVSIDIDDRTYSDDVKIIIHSDGCQEPITFNASDVANSDAIGFDYGTNKDLKK